MQKKFDETGRKNRTLKMDAKIGRQKQDVKTGRQKRTSKTGH